ncbi:meiotic recombination protein REC8 homolog [Hippoglossus stenolepis]|uniref:meiotic recombination protein REC8 homolog n=1 Tax=Hippoglossus stenolepis TaxID=195615 RepID=UPI001FB02701|nr:meiotic recombination protein REC8 homolog [Hippoglossus stenolepis]
MNKIGNDIISMSCASVRLVATKGIRVTRRDFLKVNVKSTCDDIMNYVLQRVPPPRPGLPRPRFSLYLSSQLQYGVIVVYHRQCAILLEEVHTIVGQLVKQKKTKEIDIDEQNRQSLLLPDALSLMEEAEGALDPLFGVMYMQEAMPSPSALMQIGDEYLRESSPELSEGISPPPARAPRPPRPPAAAAAAQDIGITTSPDSITLREPEPLFIPIPEFEGVELVDQDLDTVDLLMAQADHFPEGDLEMLRDEVTPREQEREMERGGGDEEQDKDRSKETTGSTTELQPTVLPGEEPTLLPQEEPDVSEERPGPPPGHITPVSEPVLPSPPSAVRRARPSLGLQSLHAREVPPPEVRRRRRKRQLIFFDPETQIPQEALQQQIDNPLTETRRPPLPPPPSSLQTHSAADLLNNPCTFLPEEVLSLWQQAANITPISGSDLQVGERGPESTDSERERDREMVEVSEREEERLELSPREVQRDLAEQEDDISGLGTLILEGSDQKERSREISPMQSLEKEGSIVSRSVSVLQDIPEVVDEFLERPAAESPGLLPDEDESAPVLFQSLLPPEADRRTVSIIFQRLLGIASARKVRVKQREPYGDIWITPGPNYRDVLQTL